MALIIKPGTIVTHPRKPEWGPGKVLVVEGGMMTVYFRDDRHCESPSGTRTISVGFGLQPAESQSDPLLDNLPPFNQSKFAGQKVRPVRLAECLDWFRQRYPLGFQDRAYVGEAAAKTGERAYKWKAHELWAHTLGNGQGRCLLHEARMDELSARVFAVDNKVNLLSQFEKMALRDALQDPAAGGRFFRSLFDLIEAEQLTEALFTPYLNAVANLPAEPGKARVNSWPVATLFPFLARPDRFMFLKPTLTREAAEIMMFDLHYDATPNWLTYAKLMELAELLMERLRDLGAQDMIDVQSFMWLVHQRGSKP